MVENKEGSPAKHVSLQAGWKDLGTGALFPVSTEGQVKLCPRVATALPVP